MRKGNREKLVTLLTKQPHAFVSGQEIADLLGISRTAIWKHITNLREEGFEIEAVQNKGYRLLKTSELYTKDAVLANLKTHKVGKQIEWYNSVSSTQIIAHKRVSEGAEDGTIIIAEEQTNGKGRHKRPWDSQKEQGIWMSVILKPPITAQKAPQFTFIASLAVVMAIYEVTKLKANIKWPNDIYINKRKVCGVLTEIQAEAETIHGVILGIGINVNQTHFPVALKEKATSLRIEKDEFVSRKKLLQAALFYLEKYYRLFMEQGFNPIKLLWEEHALPFTQKITVSVIDKKLEGTVQGISDEGVLLIKDEGGEIHSVYSADIEIN